jgi:zinc and cadmium transporter
MPAILVQPLGSALLVSLISLVGLALTPISERTLRQGLFILVSLAAGALLGDALIHLLPEAYVRAGEAAAVGVSLTALAGIFAFFVLEKFLRWRHYHNTNGGHAVDPVGPMNLLADGVHNFVDGIAIGASYLVSPAVGVATTLAVLLHEIPQEIGDFGILLHAGFSKPRALLFNFLSGCAALVGTLIVVVPGFDPEVLAAAILPFTAGMFLYIAGSDLVPDLQREQAPAKSLLQLLAMCVGAGLMLGLLAIER